MDETVLKPARSTGLILIAVVFLLGMVCGASLFYLGQRSMLGGQAIRPPQSRGFGGPPGGEHHERAIERIAKELGLDPEQKQQIATVLRESRMRVHQLVEESHAEIGELLTEEQQKMFDELHPRRRMRGKGPPRFRRRPPPPTDD
jgi:Spy/CpxP family protein refolding chaperone